MFQVSDVEIFKLFTGWNVTDFVRSVFFLRHHSKLSSSVLSGSEEVC
jgi:hypothetical protein